MTEAAGGWRARTRWAHSGAAPLRAFLRTESGSAGVLVTGGGGRPRLGQPRRGLLRGGVADRLALRLGVPGCARPARVDQRRPDDAVLPRRRPRGRREYDLGDLRERRRFVLPFAAGLVGMAIPVCIFLAVNPAGRAHGWGVAMSTDTALALGCSPSRPGRADRVRAVPAHRLRGRRPRRALVIAVVYSDRIVIRPLCLAAAVFGLSPRGVRAACGAALLRGLGIVIWLRSGGERHRAGRHRAGDRARRYRLLPEPHELERGHGRVRLFREQPTPELCAAVAASLASTLSPNARLQSFYHPWTSFVIVPLFALANAGVVLSGDLLAPRVHPPVTLGVLLGYVIGKPVAWCHVVGGHPGQPRSDPARRSAGRRFWAAARSPGSGSP